MSVTSEVGAPHGSSLLTIDLGAVAANYRLLADKAAPAATAAAVKGDAYGLGLGPVARTLNDAGCGVFFVATLDEAIALRGFLDAVEILVLNGLIAAEPRDFAEHRLIPVLNDLGQIDGWREFCTESGGHPAALHLDTGMARLGLPPAELDILAGDPARLDGIGLRCIMSHLACADQPDHALNRKQLADFTAALERLQRAPASLANSSGIFLGPDWHFDMVRPGAALYGLNPCPGQPNGMNPVVRLQAKILQIRDVDTPQTVGYGATHGFREPTRVATVAAGYADGYLRSLSGSGAACFGDVALPVVGRVSMDLITLDATRAPEARPGDMVDLIGPHHDLDALAAQAGTIGYEILTSLGRRYHRRYIDEGENSA